MGEQQEDVHTEDIIQALEDIRAIIHTYQPDVASEYVDSVVQRLVERVHNRVRNYYVASAYREAEQSHSQLWKAVFEYMTQK